MPLRSGNLSRRHDWPRHYGVGAPRPASGPALIPHDSVDGATVGGIDRRAGRCVLSAAAGPPLRADRPLVLLIGLVAFIALVAFHVRWILRSPFPQLRVIEALAVNVPLILLLFAATYVALAALSTRNFGGHLSHTDGLYFTVTVFSTVGFGDITAKTGTARLVVTGG